MSAIDDNSREPLIKGIICHAAFDWAFRDQGQALVNRMRAEVPDELGQLGLEPGRRGGGFRDSNWYAAKPVHALLDSMMRAYPESEHLELAARGGRFIFERQLRGVQRSLFKVMMKPRRYLRHAPRAWKHYFSDGSIQYSTSESGTEREWHRSMYSHWGSHHPLICRMMMSGRVVVYEAMGCLDTQLEIEHCDPTGRGCASVVSWNSASTPPPDSAP